MGRTFPTPRTQLLYRALLFFIVVFAIAALALSGVTLILDIRHLVANNTSAMQTQGNIQHLDTVLSILKDAETGQRGYLLTGLDSYLDPYRSAVAILGSEMTELRAQFADDPEIMQQLDRLRALIVSKMTIMSLTVQARRFGGLDAALPIIYTNIGRELMDSIRDLTANLVHTQNDLLTQRQAEAETSGTQTIQLAGVTGILSITLIGFAFMIVLRQSRVSLHSEFVARKEKYFSDQIANTVPIAICMFDAEQQQFTFANQPFRQLFNVAPDAQMKLGEPDFARLLQSTGLADQRKMAVKIVALKNGETLIELLYIQDGRNQPRWVEAHLKVFERLPNGEIKTILITMSDLTEQKLAADRLQANEVRYRQLARHLPDVAVMMFDHDLNYILAEGEALSRLGIKRENLEGRSLAEVVTPENLEMLRVSYFAALGGVSSNFDLESRGRLFNVTVLPVEDGFGRVEAGMVVSHDVTRQKNIENELRQNNEFVERVTNSVPSLVVVYDAETNKYVFVNRRAQVAIDLIENNDAHSPYMVLRALLHPDDVRQHDECWRQLLSDPMRGVQAELRMRGEHEPWRWMSAQYLVLTFTPQNQPKQVLMTAWDITEQKTAEEQAGQLALETERSSLIKKFMEDSSHDLNTPLTVAMTATYMINAYTGRYLQRHEKNTSETSIHDAITLAKQLKAQYDKLNPALERLKMIIANMEEMIQIDFQLDFNCEMIDLDPLVDKLVSQMRARSYDRKLTFERVGSQGLSLGCFDSEYMQKAISNILLNAIAYTPDDGTITVSTTERDGAIVIQITDTGIGIPADSLPHIFERFYRVDEARRVSTGGNGLGLSISKRIVEGHGGSIEAESKLGEGSTFRIILPVRNSLSASAPTTKHTA